MLSSVGAVGHAISGGHMSLVIADFQSCTVPAHNHLIEEVRVVLFVGLLSVYFFQSLSKYVDAVCLQASFGKKFWKFPPCYGEGKCLSVF